MPLDVMTTASTGLLGSASAEASATAAATSSAVAVTVGTKRTIAASTCGSASRRGSASAYVAAVAPAEHVDRVGHARLGREQRGERLACRLGRELRKLQALGLARVGAEDPEPARVRQHRDPASRRLGLAREERSDVDQLLERGGADHAGLLEERVDRRLRAGEGGRVRACGALAGGRRPALQSEDRLAPRDAAGDATEAARVPERLHVQQDHLRRLVVLPPLEQVVRGDVRLVPDRDERGEAEPARLGRLQQREAERAALRGEADVAARGRAGRRRSRSGSAPATAIPRQLGPISRAPCARTSASSRSWRSAPSLPTSAKPAEMTTQCADALAERLLGRLQHGVGGQRDDREIDVVRDLLDRGVPPHARDRLAVPVHGVGRAGEVAGRGCSGRARLRSSPAAGKRRCTATLRGSKNGRSEAVTAVWSRSSTRSRKCSVGAIGNCDLDLAAFQLASELEPGRLEDAEHVSVVREHLGDEAFDADAPPRALPAARAAACRCRVAGASSATANAASARRGHGART